MSKRQLLYSAATVATLVGAILGATGASASAGSLHKREIALPNVYVGYADSYRSGEISNPSPWKGSPGVTFKGCNYFHPDRCPGGKSGHSDRYDSGAVRIDNTTGTTMSITKVTVVIGSCTFNPWPKLNVSLPTGRTLVLTQTGGKPPCGHTHGSYNFDTSDTTDSCGPDDQITPRVNITISGLTITYYDSSQILNTGGVDPGFRACGHNNESHNWVQIFFGD